MRKRVFVLNLLDINDSEKSWTKRLGLNNVQIINSRAGEDKKLNRKK